MWKGRRRMTQTVSTAQGLYPGISHPGLRIHLPNRLAPPLSPPLPPPRSPLGQPLSPPSQPRLRRVPIQYVTETPRIIDLQSLPVAQPSLHGHQTFDNYGIPKSSKSSKKTKTTKVTKTKSAKTTKTKEASQPADVKDSPKPPPSPPGGGVGGLV